jgi:hypothetical protein
MNKVTKFIAGVIALGAVAIPAVAVVPVLASEAPATAVTATTPTTVPATTTPATAKAKHRVRAGRRLLRQAGINKVAAQLGVTPDALRAAVKDARTNHKPAQPITDKVARRQYWLGQMATELHVSPDALKAAVKTARQEIRTELLGK